MTKKNRYILSEENGQTIAEVNPVWKQKRQERRYNILLKKSGIPKQYLNFEFKDYKGEQSLNSYNDVVWYSHNLANEDFKHMSLYFYGPNGTQKTMMAACLGKEFTRKGYRVSFILAHSLVQCFLKNQGYEHDHENNQRLKSLRLADVIIIDDCFDIQKSTMWKNNAHLIVSEWDGFLREVIGNQQRIIITSNTPICNIDKEYGLSLKKLIERNCIEIEFRDQVQDYCTSHLKNTLRRN